MINDIYYFINEEERSILREAIKETGIDGTIVVFKKMVKNDQSFSERIVINGHDKTIDLNQNDSLFSRLAIDRAYEINSNSI